MEKPTVVLIPWDPNSPAHVQRMTEQRRVCGWHAPRVPTEWTKEHLEGKKCIYWIVFPDNEPRREKYTKMHTNKFPEEADELVDTSRTLLGLPRTPSQERFLPIGHISLATHDPVSTDKLGISVPESGSFWIKSLYISYVLQGLGLGKAAMTIAERMAAEQPLNAKHLLLDTVHHGDQSNEEYAMAVYGGLFKVPTQAWYERCGYRLIGTVQDLYKDPDSTGKIWPCRTVFLQKDLLQ